MSSAPEPLPPKPLPPENYDCCGGGCADCELKIYARELARWRKRAAAAGIMDSAPIATAPEPRLGR